MSRELGELTREEQDAIIEMRDPVVLAYDAEQMARVLQAALRGPDAYEVSGASAWMAGQICITLDRINCIYKANAKTGASAHD